MDFNQFAQYIQSLSNIIQNSESVFMNHFYEFHKYITILYSIFKEADEIREKRESRDFTPFKYITMNENMSSRILADLLNPYGAHGQKDLFLQSFMERFYPKKNIKKLKYVRVSCEACTSTIEASHRRLDILLEWPEFLLGFENKIWASDQYEQVSDYLCYLKNSGRDYALAYLTPNKRKPTEWSLKPEDAKTHEGHWICLSWAEVLEWLWDIRASILSKKVRYFVSDFINAMENTLL